jgi:hypothetical protein
MMPLMVFPTPMNLHSYPTGHYNHPSITQKEKNIAEKHVSLISASKTFYFTHYYTLWINEGCPTIPCHHAVFSTLMTPNINPAGYHSHSFVIKNGK